jgi:hypothetical protein
VGRECEIESHGADCLDVSRLDSCVEDIVVALLSRSSSHVFMVLSGWLRRELWA